MGSSSSARSSTISNDRWEDELEMDGDWEHSDPLFIDPSYTKMEPMEDDVMMDDIQPAQEDAPAKRPRGRPRKHPLPEPTATPKATKGRSKTGCITCRKRKKKCDEAKPRCMNCEKNAVVCEGYHEKQIWKSGKEKAEEERCKHEMSSVNLQPIFHGVETIEDKIFWRHYVNRLSTVLTVEGESKNAFKDILLNLANQHQGLMHSILALSSKHIEWNTPYGEKILRDNPSTNTDLLEERGEYHHDEALNRLYEDMSKTVEEDDEQYQLILAARYGQMLCLLLQNLIEGNPRGEHRVHLRAYQNLIHTAAPADPTFYAFITEFFQYHVYADDLLWHPECMTERLSLEDWEWPETIHPPRLFGVADSLFSQLSQITTIRNTIRENLAMGTDPMVDGVSLSQAADIDASIRSWAPQWPPGDSRDRVGLLYKHVLWVYLFRSIYPPSGSPSRRSTYGSISSTGASSPAGMCIPTRPSSISGLPGNTYMMSPSSMDSDSCPGSGNTSRNNSVDEDVFQNANFRNAMNTSLATPPSSTCRPSPDDKRVTVAVNEALDILESFQAHDPAQTLLLMPSLILGTVCLEPSQRNRVRSAIAAIRGYSGIRSCDRVSELLEEVWRRMEDGDWHAVWDWQGTARDMGLDFLCT